MGSTGADGNWKSWGFDALCKKAEQLAEWALAEPLSVTTESGPNLDPSSPGDDEIAEASDKITERQAAGNAAAAAAIAAEFGKVRRPSHRIIDDGGWI